MRVQRGQAALGLAAVAGWRMARVLILLVAVSFVVFSLLSLAPGRPELILLGTQPPTPELLQAIRTLYHLDDPFLIQYGRWLLNIVHLDFGRSIHTHQAVWPRVTTAFGITLMLGSLGFMFQLGVGIPLGVATAVRQGKWIDRLISASAIVGVSAPSYLSSIVLILVFAVLLPWFPVSGPGPNDADRIWYFILPALAVSSRGVALVMRMTRASLIEELGKDYIVFARARGLSVRRVIFVHALRNALLPVITVGGLMVGDLVASAVLVETTFALPGAGALLVQSVEYKDIQMVQGLAVVIAVTVAIGAVLADALYLVADPRLRLQRAM
jgi:peptide/nickel transport system permease protein